MESIENSCHIDCKLAFRVEGKIWAHEHAQHQTLNVDGDMCPRGNDLKDGSWNDTVDAHLSWERFPTPFISLFTSWKRALNKRDWLISKGAQDVVIIAVWLGGMNNVYGAVKAARLLGYSNGIQRRRRLCNHYDEVLLQGGIEADEYRILACFHGEEPVRRVRLRPSEGSHLMTSEMPGREFEDEESLLPWEVGTDMTESLKEEMYSLTGVLDIDKFAVLARAMCRGFRDGAINVFR